MERLLEQPAKATAKVKTQNCPTHGDFESRNLFRAVWSSCPACSAAKDKAEAAEAAANARAERDRRQSVALSNAAIPARFIGRTFENFRAETEEQRRALTVARDYSEGFTAYAKKGQGLLFLGQPGTGKSHLAAAILQAHMGKDVRYMTCLDLVRLIRETWRKDSARSERQVLSMLGALDLLVIDEIGVQYGTEGEQTILFDVLDLRYRDMRPTILLSNQNADGLKAYLGDRTFDRIKETSTAVQFHWASYRAQARKDAA